jgi:hypothetical protein
MSSNEKSLPITFDEARVIVRRGNSIVPLSEWMKQDKFLEELGKYKAVHYTMPKSVVMDIETRMSLNEEEDNGA